MSDKHYQELQAYGKNLKRESLSRVPNLFPEKCFNLGPVVNRLDPQCEHCWVHICTLKKELCIRSATVNDTTVNLCQECDQYEPE